MATDEEAKIAMDSFWPAYTAGIRAAPSNRQGQGVTKEDVEKATLSAYRAVIDAVEPLVRKRIAEEGTHLEETQVEFETVKITLPRLSGSREHARGVVRSAGPLEGKYVLIDTRQIRSVSPSYVEALMDEIYKQRPFVCEVRPIIKEFKEYMS